MSNATKPAPTPAPAARATTPAKPTATALPKKKIMLDIDEVDASENLERKISA